MSSSNRSGSQDELRYRALLALPLSGEDGLHQLLSALRDDSWRVRKIAVERLVEEVPPGLAVPKLIDALSDQDDASLRNSALEALVRYGPGAVSALCGALESKASDLRKFALDALGEIRSPAALSSLRSALSDTDPNVRTAAVEALGKLVSPEAFEDLLRVADGEQVDLQLAALDALGRGGAALPFELLARHLGNRYLRRAVVRALGRATGGRAQQEILTAALDPIRGTREAAFFALATEHRATRSSWQGAIGLLDPIQVEALSKAAMAMLGGEDLLAAEGAAHLLSWLGAPDVAVPLVCAAERDELRAPVKEALVFLGPPVLLPLTRAFAGLPAAARCLALEALAAMALSVATGGEGGGFLVGTQTLALRGLGDDEDEVRLSAIALLGAVADGASATSLFGLLNTGLAEAAVQAMQEIGGRDPAEIREQCRKQLLAHSGSSPDLFRLLGWVGTSEDLPTLRAALRGGAPAERRAAAEGLASLALPECTNLLRTALTDEDAGVRTHAARGLAGVRSPEAVVALVAALRDADELVAVAAAEGLGAGRIAESASDLAEAVQRELTAHPAVALAALNALAGLGTVAADLLERAGRSDDPELAKVAVRLAGRQGHWAIVHAQAQHPRWDVRCEVAAALGKEGSAEAETELDQMQRQESDAIAGKAVAAALAAIADSRPA